MTSPTDLESDLQTLTAELVEVQDHVLAMYDLARTLRGYLEPAELLAGLVSESVRLVGASGGFALLGREHGEPLVVTSPGLRLPAASVDEVVQPFLRSAQPMLQSVLSTGRVLLSSIELHDRPGAVVGLVREPGAAFRAPEQKLAAAIATYAGSQLEGVLLHQESLERARLELEFDLARSIQSGLTPAVPTGLAGLDVHAESRAASIVGGDFFDFGVRDGAGLTCVLGDVAGKGIPAAMLVAMTRAGLRAAGRGLPPNALSAAVRRANADLYQDFSQLGLFATMFLCCFLPGRRRLVFANGGHSPVIYRPARGRARLLAADECPLGVRPEWRGADSTLRFGPGYLLIAATDGFSEAYDEQTGELFGYRRLLDFADRTAGMSAAEIAAALFQATDEFGGEEASDDRTLVVVRGVPF